MAVRQGAADGDGIIEAVEDDATLEDGADAGDSSWRELGGLGEGFAADALAFAPSLANEDGRRAVAVGDFLDVDGHV